MAVFPLQVLARLAGVETPFLDSCITIGNRFLDIPLKWDCLSFWNWIGTPLSQLNA